MTKRHSTVAKVARIHFGLTEHEVAQVQSLEAMKRKIRAEVSEAVRASAMRITAINDQIHVITRRKGERREAVKEHRAQERKRE